MRIRTITCHDVYNLGASLQAFALQHYLEGQGHNVKIIDYKPYYLSNHFNLWSVSNSLYDKPFIKQLYLLAKLPGRLIAFRRKKVFDAFTSKYLSLTRRYNSYKELKAEAPEADIYIAGSDQIWNTLFQNGRDKAFYLDFGLTQVKRISYAASFATPDIVPEYREFVKKELQNFDACSIREKSSLPLLYSLGREDGVAVCDPVFLLSKEEWIDMLNNDNESVNSSNEPYILTYHTDKSLELKNIALAAQKRTGWKIYSIHGDYGDKNITIISPQQFVQLIKHAQFVISNSFHATAFSLIFEKSFCVVNRSEGINERMKSVLADFGLEERLTKTFNEKLLDKIDYDKVKVQIDEIIHFSKKWLDKSLIDE